MLVQIVDMEPYPCCDTSCPRSRMVLVLSDRILPYIRALEGVMSERMPQLHGIELNIDTLPRNTSLLFGAYLLPSHQRDRTQ